MLILFMVGSRIMEYELSNLLIKICSSIVENSLGAMPVLLFQIYLNINCVANFKGQLGDSFEMKLVC